MHERIPEGGTQRTEFFAGYVTLRTVLEFLDPHPMLLSFEQQYFWLAEVRFRDVSTAFLWARLVSYQYGSETELQASVARFLDVIEELTER